MVRETATAIDAAYRSDWSRIVAAVIRTTGDFDVAEDAVQEAFAAAMDQWPQTGVPHSPSAWILQTARNKALDRIRRQSRFKARLKDLAVKETTGAEEDSETDRDLIPDDRLRLIFTCCHPALSHEAQVALTLRMLGGLETEEIARAFLVPTATMAQRLVRAKRKIRDAGIPFAGPSPSDFASRLSAVLTVVYLIFNEGYAATRGESLVRTSLCEEAIRLARLLRTLTASAPPAEAAGLMALLLLHDSRREARVDDAGDIVLLEEQDRSRWNREQIREALSLIDEAMSDPGPFSLQAAIAAVHSRAARAEETDWREIVRLYDQLARVQPSPIIALNRAVAVAMTQGPHAGLALIDAIAAGRELDDYHLLHAARADMLRRIGSLVEAVDCYRRALDQATNESERRFLQRRIRDTELAAAVKVRSG